VFVRACKSVAYARNTVGHAIFIKHYLDHERKKVEKHWFRGGMHFSILSAP